MKTAIIIFLLLVIVIQGLRRHTLERGLRQAAQRMRAQIANETTVRLALPCPSAGAEELLVCLNDLLELRQSEKADYRRKEQELRRQIANVSHDLRTPLTSILGYLQLLEGDDLPLEKRREYFQVIEGRARTLQTFIASFYDLSRIEGGELPLEREKVELGRALSDQLTAAYEQIEEAGLEMEVDIADHLPPVWADSGAVTRIFSNLLTNALRHGSDILSVKLYREGGYIISSFSNRADDLTAEDAAHVFERFYTADKMRTGQSTGLGLAIVKALAERMGHTAAARWEDGWFTVLVRWSV
ncbi:MAG: HAMP domain-containing histidine kinase [Oscillospiraceae bacterium]|nr:HAMP domain-containing histidine kinase [Oscillospiraceae bacterium]